MNKRIVELAEQCTIIGQPKWQAEGQYAVDSFDKEKFMGLIVQECMKVAASQRNPANLNYKPSERFVEDLRQHFGVKQ